MTSPPGSTSASRISGMVLAANQSKSILNIVATSVRQENQPVSFVKQ
jgi:hypothetical protein